ncbi:hypothetical protein N3K66_001674 [Trichothecium roseum]|uniref:Uncharacterized protein n=1 Tax=Trichothecium roseum TaxID=47278 RepID=A0ACC0V7E6_9HYPO|nr:hypothetical protein N3K66_001674 [Trichothecium roseum]
MARSPPVLCGQPMVVQTRQIMYPWLLTRLSHALPASDTFSATATLFDCNGQPATGHLDGNRNVSGRPYLDGADGALYFFFDTLTIRTPGTWRIQVSISQFNASSVAQSRGTVMTAPICVVDQPVSYEEYPTDEVKQMADWFQYY